jgi:hypothetical protein
MDFSVCVLFLDLEPIQLTLDDRGMQEKTSVYMYSLFGSIPELVDSSSMLAAAISLQVSRFSPGKHVSDGLGRGGNRAVYLDIR